MNFALNKITLYMFIVATGVDFSWTWPILEQRRDSNTGIPAPILTEVSHQRSSRQVVQPAWLNPVQDAPVDPKVYVNEKALKEADIIRKTIQKAVEKDSYVVTGEEQDSNVSMPSSLEEPNTHRLPLWYLNIQKLLQNLAQRVHKGLHVLNKITRGIL